MLKFAISSVTYGRKVSVKTIVFLAIVISMASLMDGVQCGH